MNLVEAKLVPLVFPFAVVSCEVQEAHGCAHVQRDEQMAFTGTVYS